MAPNATRLPRNITGLALASLVLAGLLPAWAQAELSPIQTLSGAGHNAFYPQVAVDGNGNAVYAWVRHDTDLRRRIQARTRAADGTLSRIQPISGSGIWSSGGGQVAAGSNGQTVIVWLTGRYGHNRVEYRVRATDGSLTKPRAISDTDFNAEQFQVAVNSEGSGVFTWVLLKDPPPIRLQTKARAPDGTLSANQNLLAQGGNPSHPQIAVDPEGNAVFVWVRYDGTNIRVEALRRSVAGELSPVQTISEIGPDAIFADVAVDAAGNAVIVWTSDGDISTFRVRSRAWSADGSLSEIQDLSEAGFTGGGLDEFPQARVAVTPGGTAIFTWQVFDAVDRWVQGRARAADGTLSEVLNLFNEPKHSVTDFTTRRESRVAIDSSGNAVFTWVRFGFDEASDNRNRVQYRVRAADGVLGPVAYLSAGRSSYPQVAIDNSGNAVFVWQRHDGVSSRVQTRVLSAE